MAAGNNAVNVTNDADKSKYQYSKVNLSLENCILPTVKLSPTPSQVDGLDRESEIELRILGCELIQTSGILLRLPQVAMATGQVLFQRFYFSKSFVRHSMENAAMACITLASKIEEAPRRIRDVINVFHHIKQVKAGKTIQPLILDQNYINMKNQVIKAERRVLKELGFCVHVKHPHKIIVTLLEVLKEKKQKLMQTAWNYMNDSLRTEVFVRYDPETIACGCIFLSARVLQIPLPNKPAWYLIFGVDEKDILDICQIILSVYIRKKPDAENLEKIVEELRKTHQEAKLKAKGLSAAASVMANFSPASQSCSPRNGKSPSEVKKEKTDLKHNDISPKSNKDTNHKKRRSSRSPTEDVYLSPESKRHAGGDNKSSSSGASNSSQSPSGHRKTKTLPRGFKFKESQRSRSRTPTVKSVSKKSKHRSSHKRKKSNSLSPGSSPSQHSSKKNYSKSKHAEKVHRARSRSKSKSHERNHHSSSNSIHEKSSHKSRKDRVKENHHSSKEKKRR